MSSRSNQTVIIAVALTAAAVVGAYLYLANKQKEAEASKSKELDHSTPPRSKLSGDNNAAALTDTPIVKNTTATARDATQAPKLPTLPPSDEKALHLKIEELDKAGKALFKKKEYLEAAKAFTEALDLINVDSIDSSSSLYRQAITLMNNRSAMYEKGHQPELALEDCTVILDRLDRNHPKARHRKLRILEGQKRWTDALVEVCAIQLLYMQQNRSQLSMGLPVPSPPVPQSKMEELLTHILPPQVQQYVLRLQEKRKKRKQQQQEQQQQQQQQGQGSSSSEDNSAAAAAAAAASSTLPSSYTILQLLRSYGGYNSWMALAARDGDVQSLSNQLKALATTQGNDDVATRATKGTLLMKRGRRHVYDRHFVEAGGDFEAAYAVVHNASSSAEVASAMQGDDYARLLEWTAMVRHWNYELDAAIDCYKKCTELEPSNALLFVKQAGVYMDSGKHEEALRLFDKALGLDPVCADALLHRSNLYMLQTKPPEARKDLERCLQLQPNHVMARLRLASILAAEGDMDGAQKQLDLAEQQDPQSSEVQSYRGELYFTQGKMAEAREQFERAIALEPSNPTPFVNAALAMLNTPPPVGQQPDAAAVVKLLQRAIEADPQFTAAYIQLGQLQLGMATDLVAARKVVSLYDQGLEHCRSPEEIKELCSMRTLAVAQVDAATMLKMETFTMQ